MLHSVVNTIYRFQAVEKSSHSTGALYLTVCNNPRNIRFIHEETLLIMGIPGPVEPSLDQMNNVMEPIVEDFLDLGKGKQSIYSVRYYFTKENCAGAQF